MMNVEFRPKYGEKRFHTWEKCAGDGWLIPTFKTLENSKGSAVGSGSCHNKGYKTAISDPAIAPISLKLRFWAGRKLYTHR